MEENEMISNARFDRMEQHLKLMKDKNNEMSESMTQIKTAIIGNEYSGGIGLIHTVKDIKERISQTEDDIAILKDNMNILKWISRAIGTIIITSIAYLISKK
jgi:hypothetical protein